VPRSRDVLRERAKEGVRVVIDLRYWDLMSEKEQTSLVKQLAYCQNFNKNSSKPLNITLASCSASIKERLDRAYSAQNWAMTFAAESVL
jgi:Trm5-related predicted tRNA methylase